MLNIPNLLRFTKHDILFVFFLCDARSWYQRGLRYHITVIQCFDFLLFAQWRIGAVSPFIYPSPDHFDNAMYQRRYWEGWDKYYIATAVSLSHSLYLAKTTISQTIHIAHHFYSQFFEVDIMFPKIVSNIVQYGTSY